MHGPAIPSPRPGSLGYTTAIFGKNHYYNSAVMANASSPPPSHGWGLQSLYDGLGDGTDPGRADGGEYDTYDAWCVQVVKQS